MKKALAFLLALFVLSSCLSASASFFDTNLAKYNSAASVFGAPELKRENANNAIQDGNHVTMFKYDKMTYGFIYDQSDTIQTVAIYAKDDTCAADFLCACMAAIWFLGDFDYEAYGSLLLQFSNIRKGEEPVIMFVGKDSFTIRTSDEYKYQFFYVNTDGETS